MKRTLSVFASLICISIQAQIPKERLTDWYRTGNISPILNNRFIVSIDSFGGNPDGIHSNDEAMAKALEFLGTKKGGTLLFNEGTYLFETTIALTDSITLKGRGPSSILKFNLGGNALNCINISGSISTKQNSFYNATGGNDTITLNTNNLPEPGTIIQLFHNDSALAFNNWAYGSIGQLAMVKTALKATRQIILLTPLRMNFKPSNLTFIKVVNPIRNTSVECLKIIRMDSTASQTHNIDFNYAFNCNVRGVESEKCNFGHIVFDNSLHNEVIQSYIHHAFAYGGNGQGYGVVLQSTSGDNKIENNIFEHLRHSTLLQSGANGNVIAYNYSRDPFWSDNPLSNAAGDLVCHGNYTHHNLFEGNICQNIIVDNSHGKNGPYNTYFRNRAESYGIIVSAGQDSQNFIANEVINTGPLMGQYSITGKGHMTFKNNIKGSFQSNSTLNSIDTSLYLRSRPAFLNSAKSWPVIGFPIAYNSNQNAAFYRFRDSVEKSFCYTPSGSPANGLVKIKVPESLMIFPNPFDNFILLRSGLMPEMGLEIYNITGKKMEFEWNRDKTGICTDKWPSGLYILLIEGKYFQKLVKY